METNIPHLYHGSKDSLDIDIIYIFEKLPTAKECYEFCSETKEENRNIITIKNGLVHECFKGTPDALSNQLFMTYDNHKQKFPNPIKFLIERNIPLKNVRGIRQILGIVGKQRNYYRDLVRDSLKSMDFFKRLEVLKEIDFVHVFEFKENEEDADKIYGIKSIAFQLCQTIAQIDGVEIYSKSSVVEFDKTLKPFVYRDFEYLKESKHLELLNEYKLKIIERLHECCIEMMDNLAIFYLKEEKNLNCFTRQCRGMVIDMGKERCISHPFNYIETLESSNSDLIESVTLKEFEFHYQNFFCIFEHKSKIWKSNHSSIEEAKEKLFFQLISKLKNEDFFYIFSELKDEIFLIGMRNKFSFLMSSFSDLQKEAKELDLKSLPFEVKSPKEVKESSVIFSSGKLNFLKKE
jgi:hypothetical protein